MVLALPLPPSLLGSGATAVFRAVSKEVVKLQSEVMMTPEAYH